MQPTKVRETENKQA